MPRAHTIILAAALAVSPMAAASAQPTLKSEAAVASDIVRIGDLVAGAGELADIAVFRAPDLGHMGAVPAARVLEAVRSHGLDDVDTRGVREIAVTRLARSISVQEIEQRTIAALAGKRGLGEAENLALTFDREVRTLQVEMTAGELTLLRASYDPYSARFDVTFSLPGSTVVPRLRYTGTLVETIEVAKLVRPMGRGDVIRASDITTERRPKATVAAGALERPEQVVGFAARRALGAGQALRSADLMKPELVRQNEAVTVVYESPGLSLSIRGKALESGAAGDIVNVVNIQTKRTLQGTVTAPGRVSIAATTPPLVVSDRPPMNSTVAAAAPQQRSE
ncbi:MAG TPA: flagellar basal body P-ring formation chaperone FlgA [Xanthobacteraceae bacterium]|nr:flagellar basal body P-ring formation chaperone FlgA [Xanthobacteraceae bacterium]